MPFFAGTSNADTLTGSSGDDQVYGFDGDDVLSGDAGADFLHGGNGDDILIGGLGDDVFFGGTGSDIIRYVRATGFAGFSDVAIDFESGVDRIDVSDMGPVGIYWQPDGTTLVRTPYPLMVLTVHSRVNIGDLITSDPTQISLYGTNAVDRLFGTIERDNLYGQNGDDILSGGANHDFLSGGDGDDTLYGEDGNDRLGGGGGNDLLYGGAGSDSLTGGVGLDTLTGGEGVDWFAFQAGDSTGTSIDSIADFETGLDHLSISTAISGAVSMVRVSASATLIFASHDAAPQTVVGVNGVIQAADILTVLSQPPRVNMVGFDGADELIGAQWVDTLNGGAGDDVLNGGAGDDVLTGGAGVDTLTGGAGRDTFVYEASTGQSSTLADTITDFETGLDQIRFMQTTSPSILIERTSTGSRVSISFNYTTATGYRTGGSEYANVTSVIHGNDVVAFSASGERLGVRMVGTHQNDVLVGSDQGDWFTGNLGSDLLTGGLGADVFSYDRDGDSMDTPITGVDVITDFTTGVDSFNLGFGPSTISVVRSGGSSFVFAQYRVGGSTMQIIAQGRDVNGDDFRPGNRTVGVYMIGSADADILRGSGFADPIQGGAGNDTITGGGGADVLFGEGGADTFVYVAASDSTTMAADTLFGFVSGQDRIDLSAVRTGASDAFGVAYLNGGSFLFVDLGGNGTNDMLIQLAGTTLLASDIRWNVGAGELEPEVKSAGPEVLPVSDDVSWDEQAAMSDDVLLFLADGGSASARGHDWYL